MKLLIVFLIDYTAVLLQDELEEVIDGEFSEFLERAMNGDVEAARKLYKPSKMKSKL